jgi:hypothetical protein
MNRLPLLCLILLAVSIPSGIADAQVVIELDQVNPDGTTTKVTRRFSGSGFYYEEEIADRVTPLREAAKSGTPEALYRLGAAYESTEHHAESVELYR